MKMFASESTRTLWLVAGCFFLSGFAALVYETVWLRQFAILLGTSQEALAIVLSSYMGGLALGSLLAGKLAYRTTRPVLLYAILELGIAVTALMIPYGQRMAKTVQAFLFGGSETLPASGDLGQSLFDLATCWTLILIPTAMMGATLPLLSRMVVSKNEQVGPRIGLLYGINTLGAVTGTLFAAFLCLPYLGLSQTTWVAAFANAFVFLVVVVLAKLGAFATTLESSEELSSTTPIAEQNTPPNAEQSEPEAVRASRRRRRSSAESLGVQKSAQDSTSSDSRLRWIALFIGFSGAVSFAYEIVFTRMLGHFLGGSVFAFSTMLAGFLLGIAIGGLVASRLAIDRHRSATMFIYCQLLISLCAIFAFRWINLLAGVPPEGWFDLSITGQQVVSSMLTLLPTSTFIGATFPLAIRAFAKDESEAASGSAWTYACSTIGGILGAMLTGTLALPALGYEGTVFLAALINVAMAAASFFVFRPASVHLTAVAFSIMLVLIWRPAWPENVIRVSTLSGVSTVGAIIYDHVGQSSTVTTFYDGGAIRFQTNGLPEATVPPAGAGISYLLDTACLAGLAPLIRPGCEDLLVIGLGGGGSTAAIPASVKRIDVLEIEKAVVEANRAIAVYREHDPVTDPRVNIVINDARNALTLTKKQYDAIVSQPSHPWTAGASHLYTRQFAQIVRRRLKPGGVYVQWMNAAFVDEELLASIGATLLSVFPRVRLYQPLRGELLFVGSDELMRPEAVMPSEPGGKHRCKIDPLDRDFYRRLGIVTPTHLFSWLLLDHRGVELMSQGARPVTDERNLLAMKAPRLRRGHDPTTVPEYARGFSPIARSMAEAKRLCPSLDMEAFAQSLLRRQRHGFLQELVLPNVEDRALRRMLEAEKEIRSSGTTKAIGYLLNEVDEPEPDSRICFSLLTRRFATEPGDESISEDVYEKCLAALTPDHAAIYNAMTHWADGRFDLVKSEDETLAKAPIDDVAFRWATVARLAWRIASDDPDPLVQKQLAEDAIRIIDDAAAFVMPLSLSAYRTRAAVKADQPYVALATVDYFSSFIRQLHEKKRETKASANMLQQCLDSLYQPNVAAGVTPWRYEEVIAKVKSTLALCAAQQE